MSTGSFLVFALFFLNFLDTGFFPYVFVSAWRRLQRAVFSAFRVVVQSESCRAAVWMTGAVPPGQNREAPLHLEIRPVGSPFLCFPHLTRIFLSCFSREKKAADGKQWTERTSDSCSIIFYCRFSCGKTSVCVFWRVRRASLPNWDTFHSLSGVSCLWTLKSSTLKPRVVKDVLMPHISRP